MAAWMLTNGILAVGIENINGWLNIDDENISKEMIKDFEEHHSEKRNNYFAFILYSTFLLSIVRLIGVSGCFLWPHLGLIRFVVLMVLARPQFMQVLP